jgi:large subunit ribosomal protein L29
MAKKKAAKEKADFNEMSVPELKAKLSETQESYFRLQFRHTSNPLKNPMQIRTHRRDIARLKTYLRVKEAGAAS